MGDIIFRAKNKITETAKAITWIAREGNVNLRANGFVRMHGEEGVELLIGPPPEDKNQKMVRQAKIITVLDKGCDHKNGGALRDGLLFDKAYEFEAISFEGDWSDADYSNIRWAYRYETENGVVEDDLPAVGKKIKIRILALDLCGRGLTIYAFFKNKNKEAALNTWVHYRFRFFFRQTVKNEVQATILAPKLIDQNSTPLCGIAALVYLIARDDKLGYEQIVLNLHQKGVYQYNDFSIKLLDDTLYDMNPSNNHSYPTNNSLMRYSDWILLVAIKNAEVKAYKGEEGEQWDGITWPWDIKPLMKSLLGCKIVKDYARYITRLGLENRYTNKVNDLINMQKAWQEGYKALMLIDSNMLYNERSYVGTITTWHWIVYEGEMMIDDKGDYFIFSYFSWGSLEIKRSFKQSVFNSNFYGYIIGK